MTYAKRRAGQQGGRPADVAADGTAGILRIAAYIVGFGCYLAVVSFLGWSNVFAYSQLSFDQLVDPSTYSLVKSLLNIATYVLVAIAGGALVVSRRAEVALCAGATALMLFGAGANLAAALQPSWGIVVVSAALVGIGQASLFLAWQLVFARIDFAKPYMLPAAATALGALLYLALLRLFAQSALAVAAVVLVSASGAALAVCMRKARRSDEQRVPCGLNELGSGGFSNSARAGAKGAGRIEGFTWPKVLSRRLGSALAVFACIAFMWAMMRVYSSGPSLESDALTVVGRLMSAILVLLAYRFLSDIDMLVMFRLAFPVLAIGFILLPVVDSSQFNVAIAVLTYTVHSMISIVVMVECRALWRARGLSPLTSVGIAWGVVGVVTVAGRAVGELAISFSSVITLVFVVIYGVV